MKMVSLAPEVFNFVKNLVMSKLHIKKGDTVYVNLVKIKAKPVVLESSCKKRAIVRKVSIWFIKP